MLFNYRRKLLRSRAKIQVKIVFLPVHCSLVLIWYRLMCVSLYMFFLSSIATAISLGIPNTLIVFRTKFLNKESLVAVLYRRPQVETASELSMGWRFSSMFSHSRSQKYIKILLNFYFKHLCSFQSNNFVLLAHVQSSARFAQPSCIVVWKMIAVELQRHHVSGNKLDVSSCALVFQKEPCCMDIFVNFSADSMSARNAWML